MYVPMVSFVMTEQLWGQSFEPPIGEAGYVRLMAEHREPYRCKDGKYLAVLPYWDNHWRSFCELTGYPELAVDERFIDMATRLKNINESYRVTGEIIAERTRQEWLDLLGDTKVLMMVVNSLDDLVTDPHLVETGFWQEMDHPTEGHLRMSSPPMHMSRTPAYINHGAFASEYGCIALGRTDSTLFNHFHYNPWSTPVQNADRSLARIYQRDPLLYKWAFSKDHNHPHGPEDFEGTMARRGNEEGHDIEHYKTDGKVHDHWHGDHHHDPVSEHHHHHHGDGEDHHH